MYGQKYVTKFVRISTYPHTEYPAVMNASNICDSHCSHCIVAVKQNGLNLFYITTKYICSVQKAGHSSRKLT